MPSTPNNYQEGVSPLHNQRFPAYGEGEREITALLDKEGVITSISLSTIPLLGKSPAEIAGSSLLALIHPDDRAILQRVLISIQQAQGKRLNLACRLLDRHRVPHQFEGNITSLLLPTGSEAFVVVLRVSSGQAQDPVWHKALVPELPVSLCEMDTVLQDSVSGFLGAGLHKGDSCIVLATKPHREGLEARLRSMGLDVTAPDLQDRYIARDAIDILAKCMVDGSLDSQRFREEVAGLIWQAADDQYSVRIFDETADLLRIEGKRAAATHVEEIWKDLHHVTPPFLLVGSCTLQGQAQGDESGLFMKTGQPQARVLHDTGSRVQPSERVSDARASLLGARSAQQESGRPLPASEELFARLVEAARGEVQEAFDENEGYFRMAFTLAQMGIAFVDLTGHILQVNPAYCSITGYTAQEISHMQAAALVYEADRPRYERQIQDLCADRCSNFILEQRYLTKDRGLVWVEVSVVLVRDKQDKPLYLVAQIKDITARKQAEEDRERIFALLEKCTDFIGVADANQQVFFVNQAGRDLVGLCSEEEASRTSMLDYFPPHEQRRVMKDIFPALYKDGSWSGEVTFRHFRTGVPIPVLWNVFFLKDKESGVMQNFACIARDISETKRIEERFRLAAIVVSSDDAIISKRLDGTITSWNNAAERLFGYSAEEAIGKHITLIIPDELLREEIEIINNIKQGKRIQHYETVRQRKDGSRIYVSLSISPVKDRQGNIIGAAKIARDVSERRELEQRKDNFISMASHELKTPVTSLKGFIQILQRQMRQQEDPRTLLFLNRMDVQVKKLTALINDLLDVSKMQQGTLSFRKAILNLKELVYETVENVQAATPSHRLCVYEEVETPVQVYGDRDRLGQVLINLLNNAIKYSPDADIVQVRIRRHEERVEVAVQDFGPGIEEKYHERIFERFYQVTGPKESTYPGLGIGLYIVRAILEQHNGQIWLESQVGKGSTFYFSLPLAEEAPDRSTADA